MKNDIIRIKNISAFFRWVFIACFIAIPVLDVIGWMHAPEPQWLLIGFIKISVIPDFYLKHILHPLSSLERIGGYVVGIIPMMIEWAVLYFLIKLFRLYEQGEIFSLQVVRYLRNIGYTLLIGQLVNPIYQFLMGIVLTLRNPPGECIAAITLNQTNVGIVLTALMVILISWIMAEGCKLREEQQLTV